MTGHRRIQPPPAVRKFVEARLDEGLEIWLIGSRANPTADPPNDWDFLIFGSRQLLDALSREVEIDGLDPLIVYDGDAFESPWPRRSDGATKS